MCAGIMIKAMVKWLRENGEKTHLMNIRICLPLRQETKLRQRAEEEGKRFEPPPARPDIHEFTTEDHFGKITKHAWFVKEAFRCF